MKVDSLDQSATFIISADETLSFLAAKKEQSEQNDLEMKQCPGQLEQEQP